MRKTIKSLSISNKRYFSMLGIFSASLLLAASAVYIYSPVIGSNASDSANLRLSAKVKPVISLTLDTNTLNFSITPTSEGVFSTKQVTATVDTNSTGGYELHFSAIDNNTAMTSLTSESTITSSFNDTVTSTTMSSNTWGYSLNGTDFSKIPTLATTSTIKNVAHLPISSEEDTTVNIGVKIDSSLPSGAYTKKVLFSAIAHESLTGDTIHDITSMQEMTPLICASTTTPLSSATTFDWDGTHQDDTSYVPRTVLTDSRDNKKYIVTKLADGNCWMSQNLALDLSSSTALTNENTDLNSKASWTPVNNTQTSAGAHWGDTETASSTDHSYHPASSEAYYRSGTTMSSTPTANTDEYLWESTGNFYNWYAATAGSGTYQMTSGNAEDSICPKGWKLPENVGATSFVRLLDSVYDATATVQKTFENPLNYILSGVLGSDNQRYCQGECMNLWTSTALTQDIASGTTISYEYNTIEYRGFLLSVDPYHTKDFGASIRCVAR